MKIKKMMFLGLLALAAVLALASCTAIQSVVGGQTSTQNSGGSGGQGSRQGSGQGGQGGQGFGLTAATPIEQKLAIGTLKLEGTANAVTPQQAKTLLPLWQALKVLPAQTTTAPEEITALYTQIQETMTPQQIQAIKDLTMNGSDIRTMMSSLGIQAPAGGGGQVQRTRTAQNNGGGGGGGGGGGFGGGPGGFGGGGGGGGGQTARTPSANRTASGGGMGALFVDPVIKLLQTKAGA